MTGKSPAWDNPKAFRQQVRLAAVQVAALGEDELAAAIAYELEPFSRIPAAEAEVAWRESAESTATVKVYDVAVVRRRTAGHSPLDGVSKRLNAIVAVVALVSAVVVAFDMAAIATRRSRLEKAVASQVPLDGELRRLEGRERELRDAANAVRERREAAASAQLRAGKIRSALPDVLGAVASVCGGTIVVKEILSPSPLELELRAVAVSADVAAAVMARLGEAAAERGWRLEPGGVAVNGSATMVEFTCRLRSSAVSGDGVDGEVR